MGAFTDPRSEPGSAGHQDLVERLNAAVRALRKEAASLSNGDAGHRPADGEWSMIADNHELVRKATFGPDNSVYLLSRLGAPRGQILTLAHSHQCSF